MSDTRMKMTKGEDGSESYWFFCNGCNTHHRFVTKAGKQGGPTWTFDGNLESPTFSPSLLCNGNVELVGNMERCHLFLRAGQVQYLSDCSHHLAGKTVPVKPTRW